MLSNLRGALAVPIALALVASTASADDFDFLNRFAGQEAEAAEADADTCGCDLGCCDGCCDPWLLRDAMYGFFAFDGWANELDDDDANNFGFRVGLNAGVPAPVLRDRGIGMQIGASIGWYDLMGRHNGSFTTIEDQTMLTAGFFKRNDYMSGERISWAVVYDHQFHNSIAEEGTDYISLGQFRGLVGYALSSRYEIGFWMTQTTNDADPVPGADPGAVVEAVNQYNVFLRRYWECGGDTMVYFGVAEDPGEFVVGFDARVPLNQRWALFCAGHYIKPSADAGWPPVGDPTCQEEIWNVTAGVMFFPGSGQTCCGPNKWVPLLPVADNGTFALDQD